MGRASCEPRVEFGPAMPLARRFTTSLPATICIDHDDNENMPGVASLTMHSVGVLWLQILLSVRLGIPLTTGLRHR